MQHSLMHVLYYMFYFKIFLLQAKFISSLQLNQEEKTTQLQNRVLEVTKLEQEDSVWLALVFQTS